MNRDEDSYQLSHAYDRFLDTAPFRCVKNRRTEYQLLLMKASDRGRNVKFLGNNFGCVLSKLSSSMTRSSFIVRTLFDNM